MEKLWVCTYLETSKIPKCNLQYFHYPAISTPCFWLYVGHSVSMLNLSLGKTQSLRMNFS